MKIGIKILIIVNIFLIGTIFYQNTGKRKPIPMQQVKIDSLQNVIDSIRDEAYMWERTVDRYDVAIELFKENNPTQAEKLENCFHNVE